jgi:O-antigen/teichoic acid export membrane protein
MIYNASIASIAQLISMISSVVIMPLLTRSLGIDVFGQYIYVIAISAFFVLIIDYGFNISSTKEVSIVRDDIKLRSNIFFETLYCKVILLIISFIVVCFLIIFVESFSILKYEILVGFLYIVGFSMSPIWYYYGVERIGSISLIMMISRLIAIPLVFFFVSDESDLQAALIIYAATGILIGSLSLLYLYSKRELIWISIKLHNVILRLKSGFNLFSALLMVGLYTSVNGLLIGLVSTSSEVAKYAVIEKVVKTIEGFIATIALTIFPKISLMKSLDKDKAITMIHSAAKILVGMSIVIAISLMIYGQDVIVLLFGRQFLNIEPQVQLMSIIMIMGVFSIVIGNLGLVNLDKKKYFTRVLIISGAIHVPMILLLSSMYGSLGAVIATTLTSFYVAAGMWFYWYTKIIKYKN